MRAVLKPNGRIVLEFPYAGDFLEKTEFDTIYHEHVYYFSLMALLPLFARHGLAIFHVEKLSIHGGSLRLFAGHKDAHVEQPSVNDLLQEEQRLGFNIPAYYQHFRQQVYSIRDSLVALLTKLKSEGATIAAYGAAAKGSTMLNFCGIGKSLLDFVVDRSTHKQGRLTPGMHLPILAPEQLLARQPQYTLLLTWNFADEILAQQRAYRDAGGKFIVPIPRVSIV